MGSLKPGLVRLLTTSVVLKTVNYGARHITRPGRLGRIRSIHFARWVFVGWQGANDFLQQLRRRRRELHG